MKKQIFPKEIIENTLEVHQFKHTDKSKIIYNPLCIMESGKEKLVNKNKKIYYLLNLLAVAVWVMYFFYEVGKGSYAIYPQSLIVAP